MDYPDITSHTSDDSIAKGVPIVTERQFTRQVAFIVFWFVLGCVCFSDVFANPVGGSVAAGQATISSPNSQTEVIKQTSNKAIINWQSFNINANEKTLFQQPSASSITLNRVNPLNGISQILGLLSANGKIWLINPAGIIFGSSARVDVSGLLAATANISDQNFMSGNYRFLQSPDWNGGIINKGEITVADKGLAALVAPGVANQGIIKANLGQVILASGNEYTLDLYGDGLIEFGVGSEVTTAAEGPDGIKMQSAVSNSGAIIANGGSVLLTAQMASNTLKSSVNMSGFIRADAVAQKGGTIILSAGDQGTVNVTGKIEATGKNSGQSGGTIKLLGNTVIVNNNAVLDASGNQGGGTILIGGDEHGAGPDLDANYTYVGSQVNLYADALQNGNGGEIVAWSNQNTEFYGNADVRGGAQSGNGGFVETSSENSLTAIGANVDASAPNGSAGIWLLDPRTITIATPSGVAYDPGVNNLYANTPSTDITITPASIDSALADVVLQANRDILVDESIAIAGSGLSLTLSAARTITLASNVSISTNNADITLLANDSTSGASSAYRTSSAGSITMNSGTSIGAGTGDVSITIDPTSTSPFNPGSVTLNDISGNNLTVSSPLALTLNGTINVTGAVSLTANTSGSGAHNFSMSAGSSIDTSNATSNAVIITENDVDSGTGKIILGGIQTGDGGTISVIQNGASVGSAISATAGTTLDVGTDGVINLVVENASTNAIGSAAANISTTSTNGTLNLTLGSGGAFVTNIGSLTLAAPTVTATNYPLSITSTNVLTLQNYNYSTGTGSLTFTSDGGSLATNGDLTTGSGTLTLSGASGLTIGDTLTSGSGDISLSTLLSGDVTLNFSGSIDSSSGLLTLSSMEGVSISGTINEGSGKIAINANQGGSGTYNFVMNLGGIITTTNTAANAASITVNTTSGGSGAAQLTDITTGNSGTIAVTTAPGSNTTGGSITQLPGGLLDTDSTGASAGGTGTVTLTTATGSTSIGTSINAIQSRTGTLNLTTGSNGVYINNIGNVSGYLGNTTLSTLSYGSGSPVSVISAGALTLPTFDLVDTGSLTLESLGGVLTTRSNLGSTGAISLFSSSVMTIGANFSVSSTSGTISLLADQSGISSNGLVMDAGSSISTNNTSISAVQIEVNSGGIGTGTAAIRDISTGSGGTITVDTSGGVSGSITQVTGILNVGANGVINLLVPTASTSAIGASNNNILTTMENGTLNLTMGSGGAYVSNTGDFSLATPTVTSANFPLSIVASGTLTLPSYNFSTGTGSVIFISNGGALIVNGDISSTTGSLILSAANEIVLSNIINEGSGTVTINANQGGSGSNGFVMSSDGSIATTSGSASAVDITVNTTSGGSGSAQLASITTGNGGTISVSTAPGSNTTGGSIIQLSGGLLDTDSTGTGSGGAGTVTLTTATGSTSIGTSVSVIQTRTGTLNLTTGSNGVYINNIGNVSGYLGNTTLSTLSYGSGSPVSVVSAGALTLPTSDIVNTSSLTLESLGGVLTTRGNLGSTGAISLFSSGTMTIGTDFSVSSTSGAISLLADQSGTNANGLVMNVGSSISTNNTSISAVQIEVNSAGIGAGTAEIRDISTGSGGTMTVDTSGGVSGSITQVTGILNVGTNGVINLLVPTSSASAIGASNNNILTTMENGTLNLTMGSGGAYVSNTGDFSLATPTVTSANFPLSIVASGTLTLPSYDFATGTGSVTFTSNGGALILNGDISSTTGSLTLNAANGIPLSHVINEGSGTVTINANQGGSGSDGFVMNSSASISTTNSSANAVNITVNASSGGSGSAQLTSITAGNGGTISVITAPGSNTMGGSITQLSGGLLDADPTSAISRGTITLLTATGNTNVGTSANVLQTRAGTLNVTTGSNGVYINNIANISGYDGSTSLSTFSIDTNSPVSVISAGTLTLPTTPINTGSGDLTLESLGGSLTIRNNLITTSGEISLYSSNGMAIGANSSVSSNTGTITFLANQDGLGPNNFTLNAGSSISTNNASSNAVSIQVNKNGGGTGNVVVDSMIVAANGTITLDTSQGASGAAITESAAGTISAEQLNTSSTSGTSLTGSNTVGNFNASNSSNGSIIFDNTMDPFVLSGVTQNGGGNVTITNTGAFVTNGTISTQGGNVTLTTLTPDSSARTLTINSVITTQGGSINANAANPSGVGVALIVNNTLDTTGGTGTGIFTLGGGVLLNVSPIVGGGDITLQGNGEDLTLSTINFSTSVSFAVSRYITINGAVTTTGVGSNLTLIGDANNAGIGGVLITNTGSINVTGNLTIQGSSLSGAPGALTNGAIEIQSGASLKSVGNMTLSGNVGNSNIVVNGALQTTGSGSAITITPAGTGTVQLNAPVTTNDGAINMNGTVDLNSTANINSQGGNITINSLVGSYNANLNAGSTGNIVLGNSTVGALNIIDANNVTNQGTLMTTSFTQSAGSGSTNFGSGGLYSGPVSITTSSAYGSIYVSSLTLNVSQANLYGTINGVSSSVVLKNITLVNPISPSTQFFNGFDLFLASVSDTINQFPQVIMPGQLIAMIALNGGSDAATLQAGLGGGLSMLIDSFSEDGESCSELDPMIVMCYK